MPVNLTKRTIDALPPTEDKHGKRHYDSKVRGFGVTCYPNGRKVFFLQYGPAKQRRRMNLGTYGVDTTPEKARARAQEMLQKVAKGIDPLDERDAENSIPTFGEWVATYLEQVRLRKKHPRHDERFLAIAVKKLGRKRINEVRTVDIASLINETAQAGHKISANRFLASIRACLQAAWRIDKIESNPAMKVKPFSENAGRERTLTDDELDRFYNAVDRIKDDHVRAAFYFLMDTGARLSEVLNAKWQDVDLDEKIWRIPTTKSGKPQKLPLHPVTVAMLAGLPKAGDYIIVGKDSRKPRKDLKKPWMRIQKEAEIMDVTIHDLRRTFGRLVERAAGGHMTQRLLRHSDPRTTERHYTPVYFNEMREAMNKVVPMRRKVSGEG